MAVHPMCALRRADIGSVLVHPDGLALVVWTLAGGLLWALAALSLHGARRVAVTWVPASWREHDEYGPYLDAYLRAGYRDLRYTFSRRLTVYLVAAAAYGLAAAALSLAFYLSVAGCLALGTVWTAEYVAASRRRTVEFAHEAGLPPIPRNRWIRFWVSGSILLAWMGLLGAGCSLGFLMASLLGVR